MALLKLMLIIGIIATGILIILFLISAGAKGKQDAPHALGLPQGSIRAILALTLIVLFVFTATFFYLLTDDSEVKVALTKNILTTLGTLVIAVSSFYFGIKATEQGSKIAKATLKNNIQEENSPTGNNISPIIIYEAIVNNKDSWKKKYNAIDIKLGKKKTLEVQFELYCLLFLVKTKSNQTNKGQNVPSVISYNSKGKKYDIPTDVQEIAQS